MVPGAIYYVLIPWEKSFEWGVWIGLAIIARKWKKKNGDDNKLFSTYKFSNGPFGLWLVKHIFKRTFYIIWEQCQLHEKTTTTHK